MAVPTYLLVVFSSVIAGFSLSGADYLEYFNGKKDPI